jgi:hypothetical protein
MLNCIGVETGAAEELIEVIGKIDETDGPPATINGELAEAFADVPLSVTVTVTE